MNQGCSPAQMWRGKERAFYELRTRAMVEDRAGWQAILHPPKARHLYPFLPVSPPARILDLGCGTSASVARWYVGRPPSYVGVDFLPDLLTAARANLPGGLFVRGDVVDPPVRGPFDALLSLGTLHNLPDHRWALLRWVALLSPGGVLCFYEPGPEAFPDRHEHPHERGIDPAEVERVLGEAGLECIHRSRCNSPALGALCTAVNALHLTRLWRLQPLPFLASWFFSGLDAVLGSRLRFFRGRDLLRVFRR